MNSCCVINLWHVTLNFFFLPFFSVQRGASVGEDEDEHPERFGAEVSLLLSFAGFVVH